MKMFPAIFQGGPISGWKRLGCARLLDLELGQIVVGLTSHKQKLTAKTYLGIGLAPYQDFLSNQKSLPSDQAEILRDQKSLLSDQAEVLSDQKRRLSSQAKVLSDQKRRLNGQAEVLKYHLLEI
jgi:hypothetical protein